MTQLGSVFEDAPDGPRGKDLHYPVQVTRGGAASGAGASVRVPLRLSDDDGYVIPRQVNPNDEGDTIRIYLPIDSVSPVMVRLRGLGGALEDGIPGDLYLKVTLVEGDPTDGPEGSSALSRYARIGVLAALGSLVAAMCGAPW